MTYSAIARIERYKHYAAGGVHREAVRELFNYSNPNWKPYLVSDNVYFERTLFYGSFEKFIYKYREDHNIVGRYTEHSSNPKAETNAMCQALFTIPGYIDKLDREDQIAALRICYDFFKKEFPDVPVLEAVCHFDETSPHLHINFLPVVERYSKKNKCNEKIFSTCLLFPGREYFTQFQDRFFEYLSIHLNVTLTRHKDSGMDHVPPKVYRAISHEIADLEERASKLRSEVEYYEGVKADLSLDSSIRLAQRVQALEEENRLLLRFLSLVFKKVPSLEAAYDKFCKAFGRSRHPITPTR